jgi:predicted PurR-regulated permease PerM
MHQFTLQQKSFLLLLAIVTIGFAWVLLPFGGAVFWGVVLAIVFAPVYRWLLKKTGQKPNLASFLTLLLIIVIVILPLTLIAVSLVDQIASVVEMVRSGELTIGMFFSKVMAALPNWLVNLLDRFNLTSLASLQQKLTAAAAQISQTLALQAINVSLYTVDFLTSL